MGLVSDVDAAVTLGLEEGEGVLDVVAEAVPVAACDGVTWLVTTAVEDALTEVVAVAVAVAVTDTEVIASAVLLGVAEAVQVREGVDEAADVAAMLAVELTVPETEDVGLADADTDAVAAGVGRAEEDGGGV